MALRELLARSSVFPGLGAETKAEALSCFAKLASSAVNVDPEDVFEALKEREALSSTGFGGGIAIPHGKLEGLGAVCGFFARLDRPIEWDAIDGAPVDLLFMLLAPSSATAAHLKALARVSRALRDPETRAALRASRDADALYAILNGARAKTAAA